MFQDSLIIHTNINLIAHQFYFKQKTLKTVIKIILWDNEPNSIISGLDLTPSNNLLKWDICVCKPELTAKCLNYTSVECESCHWTKISANRLILLAWKMPERRKCPTDKTVLTSTYKTQTSELNLYYWAIKMSDLGLIDKMICGTQMLAQHTQ